MLIKIDQGLIFKQNVIIFLHSNRGKGYQKHVSMSNLETQFQKNLDQLGIIYESQKISNY